MELDTQFAGARLKAYQTEVDWRKATNYAAAIGERHCCYFDDRRPGGLIAPPMLAVALTWPLSANLGEYLEADDFPAEVLTTQVHYTERLDFYRPLRPGGRLTINGRLAGIMPHRAGTRAVMRYEAIDQKSRPVFTEHIGVMLRGVRCLGESVAIDLPGDPDGKWNDGPLWCHNIQIDPALPYVYDGCSDIVFAIHTSPAFATAVGLPGNILQGTCTLALAAREIIQREAACNPEGLKTISCRFSDMVFPGNPISVNLRSRHENHLYFDVTNHEGKKAISKGYARLGDP